MSVATVSVDELRAAARFVQERRQLGGASRGGSAEMPAPGTVVPMVDLAGIDLSAVTVVQVGGAHGGAGASVMAVAIAEAAAAAAGRVRLLDTAHPAASGLACAGQDRGPDGTGWLVSVRGDVEIDRLDPDRTSRPPRLRPVDGVVASVIDVGTGALASVQSARSVLVARGGPAGLRAVESRLARTAEAAGQPVVVLVGRAPRHLRLYPCLGALAEQGRVVRAPFCRRLDGVGISGDDLPASVIAAGRSVWDAATDPPHDRTSGNAARGQ